MRRKHLDYLMFNFKKIILAGKNYETEDKLKGK